MNEQITQLLVNYKDGVPIRVERTTIIELCVAAVLTVAVSAAVAKFIRKI